MPPRQSQQGNGMLFRDTDALSVICDMSCGRLPKHGRGRPCHFSSETRERTSKRSPGPSLHLCIVIQSQSQSSGGGRELAQKIKAIGNAYPAIELFDVIMQRGWRKAQPEGDLLFDLAGAEALDDLPHTRGQISRRVGCVRPPP